MKWLPRHRKFMWWGFSFLLILLFFGFSIPTLSISEQRDEEGILVPLLFDKNFSISYLHSVHKTPVKENFVLTDDQSLKLLSAEYLSLGVGTPFLESEGTLENKDGVFILTGIDKHFVSIYVAYVPYTQQNIEYNEKKIQFTSHFKPGALVCIKPVKYSVAQLVWQQIKGEKEVDFCLGK